MEERKDEQLPQDKDRHLDVPAEARRDNNINFLELEETDTDNNNSNKELTERQKEWKEGLEEGKKLRDSE